MEIWLKESDKNAFRLPVLPKDYTMTSGNTVNTITTNETGEVAIFSGQKLYSITLSSLFPRQQYSFCQYKISLTPNKSVEKIDNWRKAGKVLRLIITDTNVNIPVIIEHFRWGEQDGSRDIYYEIILREYRYLTTKNTNNNNNNINNNNKRPSPNNDKKQRTYTVKSGDSLWSIAVKYYNDGSKYTTIANANGIKNANSISVGQVLVIP